MDKDKITIPKPIKMTIWVVIIIAIAKLAYDMAEVDEEGVVRVGSRPYTYIVPGGHSLNFGILDKDVVWAMKVGDEVFLRPAINDSRYQDFHFTNKIEKVTVWVPEGQGVKKARFRFIATPIMYSKEIKVKESWSWNEFK